MSALAALVRFDGGPLEPGLVEPGLVEAMTEAMAHRGPDGLRCRSLGPAALGHGMLRTTPESHEETQPLANEDASVALVMDGRLDNREELRAALAARGARLRDRSDAELALRAYESWGAACPERMDGDFALVVWDARRGEVFCARDRLGHRPLHYHWDGRRLAVASELHAILALPWVEEALNEGMLAELLADDLYALDETLWSGIFRLPPARRMRVDAGGPRIERYWAPDLGAELRYRREEEYVEHYRALLEDVVRRQSRADRPLACEVSGGLDSSAVFAVAETLRRQGRLPAPGIDAYTLRFEGGAAGSDLEHARAVGAHLGCPVTEIAPTLKPLDWYRDWARRYRDLPGAPHGTMQLAIREAAAERGSRVVLGGVGGDQWLTGDHTYFAASLAAGRWGEFLGCLKSDARAYGLRRSLYLAARYGAVPLLPAALRRQARQLLARARGEAEADWLAGPLAAALAERRRRRPPPEPDRQRPEHRQRFRTLLSADMALAHESMDRLAASLGLEQRWPLDSAPLVQFGFSVPQHWLLRAGRNRYIHRRALEHVLPESVTRRHGKAEFSVVFEHHGAALREALDPAFASLPRPWVSDDGLARLRTGAEANRLRDLMLMWRLFACDAVRRAGQDAPKFKARAAIS